jgi:hypothetical protein
MVFLVGGGAGRDPDFRAFWRVSNPLLLPPLQPSPPPPRTLENTDKDIKMGPPPPTKENSASTPPPPPQPSSL